MLVICNRFLYEKIIYFASSALIEILFDVRQLLINCGVAGVECKGEVFYSQEYSREESILPLFVGSIINYLQ